MRYLHLIGCLLFCVLLISACDSPSEKGSKDTGEKTIQKRDEPLDDSQTTGSEITSRLGRKISDLSESGLSVPEQLFKIAKIANQETLAMIKAAKSHRVSLEEAIGYISYIDSLMFIFDTGIKIAGKSNDYATVARVKSLQKQLIQTTTQLGMLFPENK